MTWNDKIPAVKYTLIGLVLALMPLSAKAWIEVGQYEDSMYYPFPAYNSNSKSQFIIPAEQIGGTGMLEGLEFYLTVCGETMSSVEVRVKSLPAGSSFLPNTFFADGLNDWGTFTDVDFCPDTPGWVRFNSTSNTPILEEGEDLLIEVCVDIVAEGADNLVACWASEDGGLALESSNACEDLTGFAVDFLPQLRLHGLTRPISGTWYSGQEIHVSSDICVPEGESLEIRPNVDVIFDGPHVMEVEGQLNVLGRADAPVLFTAPDSTVGWNGIKMMNQSSLTMKHAKIEHFRSYQADVNNSAAISTFQSDTIHIENTLLSDCYGFYAGAIDLYNSNSLLKDLTFENCGVHLENRDILKVNSITQIVHIDGIVVRESPSSLTASIALSGNHGHILMENSLIEMSPKDSYFYSGVTLRNNTFVRKSATSVCLKYNGSHDSELVNNVFASAGTYYDLLATFNVGMYYGHNLFQNSIGVLGEDHLIEGGGNLYEVDPVFIDEIDYRLAAGSPGIDGGDPYLPYDPDMTRSDMGAYFLDQSVPVLTTLQDVPEDQGRQLQLVWDASSMDVSDLGEYGSYSVWRHDDLNGEMRSAASLTIRKASDLLDLDESQREDLYWQRDDGTIWNFVSQLPANRYGEYGYVSPTLQDSSEVAANASTFRVLWHCSSHTSESLADSASSIDNIAPDAVRDLQAQADVELIVLNWSEVTTGTLDGNSYPELNGVQYQVYHGDEVDFPCDEAHFLTSTSETTLEFTVPAGDSMGFYKIRTSDFR